MSQSDNVSSDDLLTQDIVFCYDYQQPRGCQWPLCKYVHCKPEEEALYRNHTTMTDSVREQIHRGIGLVQPICKDFLNNCCNRPRCRFRHQKPERSSELYQRENADLKKELQHLKREVSDLRTMNNLLLQVNSDLRIRLACNTTSPLTLCGTTLFSNESRNHQSELMPHLTMPPLFRRTSSNLPNFLFMSNSSLDKLN